MAEPSMSAESLELPSSTDDLPFDCSNPIPSALLDDNLLSDTIAKHDGTPVAEWLADTADERFGLAGDQLISMGDDLIGGDRDEMMASSSGAATHLDDDLDADSKSVFTVHEMGTLHGSDVIGSTDFDLVDTIIQGGMQVDPTVIAKPFVEPADSQSNLASVASDGSSVSPLPTAQTVPRRRGRKPKALLQQEAAAAAAAAAAARNASSSKQPVGSQVGKAGKVASSSSRSSSSSSIVVPTSAGSSGSKRTGSPTSSGNGRPASGTSSAGTPAVGTPSAGAPSARAPASSNPAAGTPAAGTPAAGTPAAGTSAAGTPAAGTPLCGTSSAGSSSAGGQPRRSVRICEQDPRDFLQELRQGHYLKPRMPSSPNKVAQFGKKAGEPKAGDSFATADGSPAAASGEVKVPLASEALKTGTSPPLEPTSTPTSGRKRKAGGGSSAGEQRLDTKDSTAKKKKSTAADSSDDSDASSSSSDDPDSVPLMQIKQKLASSGASPALAQRLAQAAAAADDPDSVPLVQIKRSLQEAESGAAAKLAPPVKRKAGRPPKNPQAAGGGAAQPSKQKAKRPDEDVTAAAKQGSTLALPTAAAAAAADGRGSSAAPTPSAAGSSGEGLQAAEPVKKKKKKKLEGGSDQRQPGQHRGTPVPPPLQQRKQAPAVASDGAPRGAPLAVADSRATAAHASVASAAGDAAAAASVAKKPVGLLSKGSNPVVALGAQVTSGSSSGKPPLLADKVKADKMKATDGGKDKVRPAAAAGEASARPSSSSAAAATAAATPTAATGISAASAAALKRKAAAVADTGGDWSPAAKAVKAASAGAAGPSTDGRTELAKKHPKSAGKAGAPAPALGDRTPAKSSASKEGRHEPARGEGVRQSSSGGSGAAAGAADSKGKPGSDSGDLDDDALSSGRFTFIDNVEEDGSDRDEENDPDRLWCICKRPHDNRFMICCDRCQEWYHGDCVGITKARGKQIEINREEYVCKTCKEGENASKPHIGSDSARGDRMKEREAKERVETSMTKGAWKDGGRSPASAVGSQIGEIRKKPSTVSKDSPATRGDAGGRAKKRMFKKFKTKPPQRPCIAASCDRLAEAGAVYCGPGCIRRYASDMLRLLESRHAELQRLKASLAKRARAPVLPASAVVVIERYSGKVLSGSQAPNRATLSEFLLKHPSFEVLQPGREHKPSGTVPVSPARFYHKDKQQPRESPGGASVAEGAKPERKGSSSSAQSTTSRQNSSSSTVSGATASAAAAVAAAAEAPAPDPETIRRNVRKTLREMLWNRVKEADDISVSEGYVENIALAIEVELFNLQHDTGARYKSKYRSLLFNIKDPKNKGLFRKIVKSRIRPDKLVHMSSDELASKELMQWRESEMKHELDKIKEVEELRSHEEEPRVLHISHKQEVELVNDDLSDLRQVVLEEKPKDMDLDVTAKNVELDPAAGTDKSSEPAASAAAAAVSSGGGAAAATPSDTTALHSSHLFDRNCKVCTGQQAPPVAAAGPKKAPKVERHVHLAKDERRHVKVQLSAQPREVVDRVVARELRHLGRELEDMKRADAELLHRTAASAAVPRSPPMEPTSTVESPRHQAEHVTTSAASTGSRTAPASARAASVPPPLWKGSLNAPEVTKFFAAAYALTGPVENVKADLPDALNIVGRITPDQIWSYLAQLKLSTSKDVIVLSLTPLTDDEQPGYAAYYKYLHSKSRCGVVGNAAKTIKDMYIIPLSMDEGVPPQLVQYCGSTVHPGLAGLKSHSLISVIVRSKSKKPEAVGSRAKKLADHRKTVTFASSTPPVDTDAEAYEPYDPETPAVDYNWKPVAATASLASSTADPIVRAYAQPDPRKLTALDVPGASPYSPTQSDYNNDEAYDPADDLQPVLPAVQPPGGAAVLSAAGSAAFGGASSGGDLAEYKRSIEALNKRIEAEQEELRSKTLLLSAATSADGAGSAATAASVLSPSAAALLLSPAAAAAAAGLPLPKALQEIMNSSTFAAAAAAAATATVATTAAGDGKPPVVDVLGYLKQTLLEQVKRPLRSSVAAAPGAPFAVADPRVGARPPGAPADPRLPPRAAAAPAPTLAAGAATSYPAAAVYNYATVPSAAAASLASSIAQAAGAGATALSQHGYVATAQPAVAAVPYAAVVPAVAEQVPAQRYFTATTPPAAASAYPQATEMAIPGLGDGIDWSTAGTAAASRGGHSPYLLDERDYDERQPAAAFGSGPSAGGSGRAAIVHPPQPPPVQRTTEPEEEQQQRVVEDFQDHDYRTRPPQAGAGPRSSGAVSNDVSNDYGDHDERRRGAGGGRATSGLPAWHGDGSHSPEHWQQQQHWRGGGGRPSRDDRRPRGHGGAR